jgi:hypothetical protein
MDNITKQVKLTKRGLPDKRAQSSKKNLEKGKSIIREALKQVKEKKTGEAKRVTNLSSSSAQALPSSLCSSDEYSSDEEEIVLTTKVIPNVLSRKDTKDLPTPNQINISPVTQFSNPSPSLPSLPSFSFEQTFNERLKVLDEVYNKKLSSIEEKHSESTKLTRAEINAIKQQNEALKKSMTSSFRTHAGVMNQEMFLKF